MQKYVEKYVRSIPWVLNSIFLTALILSLWVSIRPLYDAAVRREMDQVFAAKIGLDTAIQASLYQMGVTAALVAKDPQVQQSLANLIESSSDEKLEEVLHLLLDYQKSARLDYLEVISPNGLVLLNLSMPERRNQDVQNWNVFAGTTESENAASLSSVGQGLYATSSAFVRSKGRPVGVIVAGTELDFKWLKDKSRDLTAELALSLQNERVLSTLADGDSEPITTPLFQEVKDGILKLMGKRFAIGQIPLKSSQLKGKGNDVIAHVAILTSLEGFYSTLQSLLKKAALILIPMAVGSILLVLIIGRGMVVFTLKLDRLKNQLEKVLLGTQELASSRTQVEAVKIAIETISEEVLGQKTVPAQVLLLPRDLSGGSKEPKNDIAVLKIAFGVERDNQVQGSWSESQVERSFIQNAFSHGHAFQAESGLLTVPIFFGEKQLGLIEIQAKDSLLPIGENELQFASTLASSLAISLENIAYVSDSQTKVKLEAEMEAAKTVQESLLPRHSDFPGMEISTTFQSASHTGGDWYGHLYDEAEHALYFYIGDVTGHGFPSALLTGVVCGAIYSCQYTFQNLAQEKSLSDDPVENHLLRVAKVVNQLVRQTGRNRLLMTMLFVRLNLSTGHVSILNAGHNAPFWLNQSENKVKTIVSTGSRMGFTNEPYFAVKSFQLKPNDLIFLFTDGLIENTNASGKTLTEKQIREAMLTGRKADELVATIVKQAKSLWEDHPAADDYTILAFRWLGPIPRGSLEFQHKNFVQFHYVPELKDEK